MTKQNNMLGILLSFAGYSAWVVGDTFVKLAGETLPVVEILAIDLLISSLLMAMVAAWDGGLKQLSTKRPGFHLLRSAFIMAATYGSMTGIVHLSLADFYTVIFTSPLILIVLGRIFLKERVDYKMWLAIGFGFIGVLIAVQFSGSSDSRFSWVGIIVTTIASLSLATAMLAARSATSESNYALSFWPQLASFTASVVLMICFGAHVMNVTGIIYAILSGAMGGAGVLLTNASLRVAPVAVVSPYHYTQIIGGAFAGYLIWGHVPAWSVIAGAVMVTISGLYILRAETVKKNLPSSVATFQV